ncbi:vascular endothelial growth factor A-like [Pholidichthys leucotaenia]
MARQLSEEDKHTNSYIVMEFPEMLAKSLCQPMEQLVEVERDFPEEIEHVFVPACVPLWRCSGCCMDEKLECQPTLERNITLPLSSSKSIKSRPRRRKRKKTASICAE